MFFNWISNLPSLVVVKIMCDVLNLGLKKEKKKEEGIGVNFLKF